MGSISMLQWKKAYMLEFIEGKVAKDVFTFSVPPESEDFQFPARITETKTFGGSVFDDYGNDTYKITLSGSTVNEDKKLIYKGFGKPPRFLTGTQELFELQKIIKNWNDGKAAAGVFRSSFDPIGAQKKVYLYDLSKMSALQIAAGKASRNYWRVFIKELKIKRDKSKPFTFNYTLEMLGVEDEPLGRGGKLGAFGDAVGKIQNVMDKIKVIQDWTEGSIEAFNQIASAAQTVTKTYRAMHEQNQAGALSAGSITLMSAGHADAVSRIIGGEHNSFYNASKGLLESVSKWKNFKRITKDFKTQNTDKFKAYFNTAGGTVIGAQEVKFGSRLRKPDTPRKADYSFSGWFLDSKLTESYDFSKPVTQALTLYAGWKLEKATITFQSRNGTPVAPLKVPVGEVAFPPPAPEKNRFAFHRWNSDFDCLHEFDFSTPIEKNITLYASWIPAYAVVFDASGGSAVKTQMVAKKGRAVYPKTPVKEHYVFTEWRKEGEDKPFDFSGPITEDTTLYAVYAQVSNKVTFNAMGGSAVASQTVKIGGKVQQPQKPVRKGFGFVRWCSDAACLHPFDFTKPVNSPLTLYAEWTRSVYTVSFETGGGSAIEAQRVIHNALAVFPEIPKKAGKVFTMWIKKKAGGAKEEFDFATPITEDVTLYAEYFGGD